MGSQRTWQVWIQAYRRLTKPKASGRSSGRRQAATTVGTASRNKSHKGSSDGSRNRTPTPEAKPRPLAISSGFELRRRKDLLRLPASSRQKQAVVDFELQRRKGRKGFL